MTTAYLLIPAFMLVILLTWLFLRLRLSMDYLSLSAVE